MDTQVINSPDGDASSNIGPDGKPLIVVDAPTLGATKLPFYAPNVKYGDRGPAVQALQTLLHAVLGKYVQSAVDGIYGSKTVNDVHRFKYQNPRPGYSSNGTLWELEDWIIAEKIVLSHSQVLKYLAAAEKAAKTPVETPRDKVLKAAQYGYAHRMNIHYQEIRPMPSSLTLAATQIIYTDCSGYATLCYKMAGQPDPNGFGYNGYGYTGTMLLHGKQISLADIQVGDLVFYGKPTVVHVAVYAGNGMVYSNGLYPMQYAPTNLWGGLPINSVRSYL